MKKKELKDKLKEIFEFIFIILFIILFTALCIWGGYTSYIDYENKFLLNDYLKSGGLPQNE